MFVLVSSEYSMKLLFLFISDETGARPISTQPSTCFLAHRREGNPRNNNNNIRVKPEHCMDGHMNGLNPFGQLLHSDKDQPFMSNHLNNLTAMTQVCIIN